MVIERLLPLQKKPTESFFLWGPRKTGKTTLLECYYPKAFWVNLLKTDEFLKYSKAPYLLREELNALDGQKLVIIDEVQKIPQLLDEVHYLIEKNKIIFGLCGSSARKVKRGHANLLGGRAIRYELFGLSAQELKTKFDINKILNYGYIPSHYLHKNPKRIIRSYVNNYLKEEILDEGLVRNLPIFSRFLEVATLSDTNTINYTNIASDCGVSSTTVKEYFLILEDTLLGRYLPAYVKKPKRKVKRIPKFYFSDVGIVNELAKRRHLEMGSEAFGKAFENWCFHELITHREYTENFYDLSFWSLSTGAEVDFILGDMEVAIEVKSSTSFSKRHLKGLRELKVEHPNVKKRILVCCEERRRRTDDDILILPYLDFIEMLWEGEII